MADFIITIRPEPDASRDVDLLRHYQVPAMAVPMMYNEKRPFNMPDVALFQAIVFTSRYAVAALADSSKNLSLRSLPVYAVGRSTALAARRASPPGPEMFPSPPAALLLLLLLPGRSN